MAADDPLQIKSTGHKAHPSSANRGRRMALEMTNGPRPGAARDVSLRAGAKGIDGTTDATDEKNQAWHERIHRAAREAEIALTRPRRQFDMVGCGRAHQGVMLSARVLTDTSTIKECCDNPPPPRLP